MADDVVGNRDEGREKGPTIYETDNTWHFCKTHGIDFKSAQAKAPVVIYGSR